MDIFNKTKKLNFQICFFILKRQEGDCRLRIVYNRILSCIIEIDVIMIINFVSIL